MQTKTLIRTSSALPALPLAIGIAVLFYVTDTHRQIDYWPYPYAPTLVQRSIESMYAVTYALVSAASAWQGGRLKEAGVWEAAPYRPKRQIVALALTPVVAVGWLMLIVPVVMAFVQRPVWPTLDSLPPLVLGMLLCIAHAVIGFVAGQWIKPVLAVPILACTVFVLVAYPHAMEPFFLRHIMGEYFGHIGFGETATFESMLALFLPTASVAVASTLVWVKLSTAVRVLAAVALVTASTFTAYSMTKDWDYNPSVNIGNVSTVCTGNSPEVCMPEQASGSLDEVHSEVVATFTMLRKYGVVGTVPEKVEEAISYGRFTPDNTEDTLYLWLSNAHRKGRVEASVIGASVSFPCETPEPRAIRTVSLWLEEKTGGIPDYEQLAAGDPYYDRAQHRETVETVEEVSAKSAADQAAWYRSTVAEACEGSR